MAQHREEHPDAFGQQWHDETAFDDAAELEAFLDAKRSEEPPGKVSFDCRPALRPIGYQRDQSDRRELKRAFAHGVRPLPTVWVRLANEAVTSAQTESGTELSR